jgi:beta-glucosidase-like glycosyl hydrolase
LANEENIREKARRWAGQMLTLKEAAEPFKPYFFVGSPMDLALENAYRAALNILKLSPFSPEVIEEEQIDDLVRRIVREIEQVEVPAAG